MARALFLWLCLFPAFARADPPAADYRPDPAGVQRYGPAYRFPQAGWIVLHIEGEPYERGYQHGRLLAAEIAAHLRCFAAIQSPKAPSEGWQITRRLADALFLRRFAREYLEEMKGIAEGATAAGARVFGRPIDLVDVVALNCWAEIESLDSALEATPTGLEGLRFPRPQPRAMPKPRPEHCSAFAATGPATADGKIVFGHITMFSLYPASYYNVWLDVKPAKGHRFLMCAYPGGMQSGLDYYMNAAGLLIAETTIAQTRFDIRGLTEASRIRQAIQYAATIDEAVAILQKDNNGLYTNEWLLGDVNTNEIALFELGTHKSKLRRSGKNEWFGNTPGFYWGCNNTKDLEVRLETIPSVDGKPANLVFRPSARDIAWQRLYHKHKGKIGVAFGKEAFTTPPIAAFHSLDAKFTTTDLAKQLKTWALFGPPLGKTWQPTQEERTLYPEIKPLVSNPWTILHGKAPPQTDILAADLPDPKSEQAKADDNKETPQSAPAWHGTLLPQSDADIWLAAAFAEYERIVAKEKTLRGPKHDRALTPADRDDLALDLFAFRSAYLTAVRTAGDVSLANIKSDLAADAWYRLASGKGVLALHELRRLLGEQFFEETMDSFGREHAGKRVSTAQFQAHVERWAVWPRGKFFDSWLRKPGLPALHLGPVSVSAVDKSRCRVHGEIHRDVQDLALAKVDVTVETDKDEITKTIPLNGTRTEFSIEIASDRPRRLIVEKYGATLQPGSAFSVMSSYRELEHTLIVYGTLDEVPTNREAAQGLQEAIRQSGPNFTVALKTDKDVTDDDLKTHHVLLIGRPDTNLLVECFRKDVPIRFGSLSIIVRGKTYAHPGSAVVVAADNPLNKRYSLVVIAGLSADSTLRAPQTLVSRRQRAGDILLLPNGGPAQALLLPAPDLVRELNSR